MKAINEVADASNNGRFHILNSMSSRFHYFLVELIVEDCYSNLCMYALLVDLQSGICYENNGNKFFGKNSQNF